MGSILGIWVLNHRVVCRAAALRLPYKAAMSLTMLMLTTLSPVWAKSTTALLIAKEGQNINVTFDPATLPDVASRHSNGKTILLIPKSTDTRAIHWLVEPVLQKTNVVTEMATAAETIITIDSRNVFFISKDLSRFQPPAVASVPEMPKKVMLAKVESPQRHSLKLSDTPDSKALNPLKPVNASAGQGNPSRLRPGNTVLSPEEAPLEPLSVNTASKKLPINASSAWRLSAQASENSDKTAKNPELEPLKLDNQKADASALSPNAGGVYDPENEPLSQYQKQQASVSAEANGAMVRVTLSLVAVLGLMLLFAKLILPRLMARYPQFFEALQRQQQASMVRDADSMRGSVKPRPPKSLRGLGEEAETPEAIGFFAPMKRLITTNTPITRGKRQYLERLSLDNKPFRVLDSTDLGRGKELHLVEIMGRQLVVATTPYTVTLLKDLSDQNPDTMPDEASQQRIYSRLGVDSPLNETHVQNSTLKNTSGPSEMRDDYDDAPYNVHTRYLHPEERLPSSDLDYADEVYSYAPKDFSDTNSEIEGRTEAKLGADSNLNSESEPGLTLNSPKRPEINGSHQSGEPHRIQFAHNGVGKQNPYGMKPSGARVKRSNSSVNQEMIVSSSTPEPENVGIASLNALSDDTDTLEKKELPSLSLPDNKKAPAPEHTYGKTGVDLPRMTLSAATPSSEVPVHLKYLESAEMTHRQRAQQQQRDVYRNKQSRKPKPEQFSDSPSSSDALVFLTDYDDVYGE